MKIVIQKEPFEPYQAVSNYQKTLNKQHGGSVTFVGTMRDFNEDKPIDSLFLEHYPGMTEKKIEHICENASKKWEILDLIVIHRVGLILPSEAIVVIAVWSEHRSGAFNACRFIINELKTNAPFWKCEQLGDINKWVLKNTTDNT